MRCAVALPWKHRERRPGPEAICAGCAIEQGWLEPDRKTLGGAFAECDLIDERIVNQSES
jgi:hypothetical protein